MLTKIISALFIVVVGPLLVWFLAQKFSDKPILKFNLSEPISTTISDNNKEYIQELYIKNVGKDEAKNISIRIPAAGAKFEVRKNSASDVFTIDKLEGDTEIHYNSLPPSGEIRIIIKSQTSIFKNLIKISHSKGLALEAFSEGSLFSLAGSLIYAVLGIGFLLYLIYGMYSFSQTFISYSKEEVFLGRKKPLLISDKKWNNVRNEAKNTLLENSITSREEIIASFCYRFLNNKSCAKIADMEIDSFNNKCCDKIKKYFAESTHRAYSLKDLSLLFTIEKPIVMPDDKWEDIQKYLYNKYISQYLGGLYLSDRTELRAEDIQCPEFIPRITWQKIVDDVISVVTGNIISEIFRSKHIDPAIVCDEDRINGLPNRNIQIIKRVAFSLGIFKSRFEYTKKDAQNLLDEVNNSKLLNEESEKEPLVKFCQHILDVYEKESDTSAREVTISNRETDFEKLQVNFQAARNKVLKQLEIIDSLLNRDRNFLEKIEDYEMPFSPGNEENLRIIATLLQEKNMVS